MNDFQDVYIDRIDIKSALSGTLPTDPPLLEELGINFRTIRQESTLIFKPTLKIENSDITGPIIIVLLYSLLLLLNGKVHFGYVYFVTLASNLLIYFLLNVLKEINKDVTLQIIFSVLGYSFVPLVLYSFFRLFFRVDFVGYLCVLWSSYVASVVFCRYLEMERLVFVVGWPILLVYVCFLLLIIF